MNPDGSNQQILFSPTSIAPCFDRPTYSPDGAKIIFGFSSDCGTTHKSVATMNSDGTNFIQGGFGLYPTYSPDGVKIASVCCYFGFPNPPKLSTYNVSGGATQTFTRNLSFDVVPDWQGFRVARAPFDFDGDGRSDISVFRPSNNAWYILQSSGGLWVPVWGLSTDVLTPADYDGDLKTDVAIWRPTDGNFYILNSFNSTVRVENLGLAGDIPTGGDWDGDGKVDPAVYRDGAQGNFYYRGSMGNPQQNITFVPWGISGDKPVVGDYDGDGRTDAAIYRNGVWWIKQSSNGQGLAYSFGLTNDKVTPADYDGDGKTDLAVYRDGIWYVLNSTQGFAAVQFGIANDLPAPADYDGDGKADPTVYRNGVWWILKSQSGAAQAVSFGLNTDKPIPSAFVR
jgi:hypothetical protein